MSILSQSSGGSGIQNWTQHSMPIGNWWGIAYGNGAFVAVSYSYNTSATSTDNGKTWTQHDMPIDGWRGITYGDGVFVAVSSSSNTSVTSTDNGETWKG